MINMNHAKYTGVDVITELGRRRLGRVQSVAPTSQTNQTTVNQLGSEASVGVVNDPPTFSADIQTFLTSGYNIFAMAGEDWTAAADGDSIELSDIKAADLAIPIKASGSANTVARTLYLGGSRLTAFALSASVGQDVTANYTFSSSGVRMLKTALAIEAITVAGGSFTTTGTPIQLRNGAYFLKVHDQDVSAIGRTNATTFTTTLADGTYYAAFRVAGAAGTWQDTSSLYPTDEPASLRGYHVELWVTKDSDPDFQPRAVQSVSLNASFPGEDVNELCNIDPIVRVENIPEITGSLSYLTNGTYELEDKFADADSVDDYSLSDYVGDGYGFELRFFNTTDKVARIANGPLMTVYVPDITVSATNFSAQVQQNNTNSFDIRSGAGQLFVYKGARP